MNGKITIDFDNDGVLANIKLQSSLQERIVLVTDILPEIFDKLTRKLIKETIIHSDDFIPMAGRKNSAIEVSGNTPDINMQDNL